MKKSWSQAFVKQCLDEPQRPKSSGDLYWQNKYLNYWIYYKSKTHFTHGYTPCNTLNLTHRINNALPQVHIAHSLSPLKNSGIRELGGWENRTLTLLPSGFLQPTLYSTLFSYTFSVPQNTLVCNYPSVQAVFLHQWTNQPLQPAEKSSKISFATLKATENIGNVPRWGKKMY